MGFRSDFPIRLSGPSFRSEFPIRFSDRDPPILKRCSLGIVLNAAKVYDIDEHPDFVAKVMPAITSKNWKEGYDQNEREYAALKQVESFAGAPRVLSYDKDVAFVNNWGERDTINILIVGKLGNQQPTYWVWLKTPVPHNHLTRNHNLGKLVAKMRRKCPRMPS